MDKSKKEVADKLLLALNQVRKIKFYPKDADGITHAEMMLLVCIRKSLKIDENGVKVSQLSKKLRIASPTVTQQINSMEKNGFVQRSMDLNDRRVVRVQLTEKGEEHLKKAEKDFWKFVEELVEYMGNEKSDKFADLLIELADYMNKRNK
ncbi:MarR family winged helix-turn-helix transcriptional regulator [Clostridium felsineum]|uniref:Uncharacterized protein n=1 Tax=Clostridium felsineum TaxID=36839 RepID=A0A1S8LWR9_9CLOT|nr:MarR family transcriptional regulator [Clostridium felsineum]MCR3757673.1 MarR family transcriptional regulator [Clostridium felsineum]URZ03277.1 hypothetical protein CLAUR_033230 [Clostridium felsineum]URZ08389.1 hypothetical protein CLROS_037710 [Clostridium felsineum]URZ13420.1 hypothetical protein CROST_041860 [Clostridium felsineum]URZ14605.1 hypothetical protein CLFE_006020 [Clostridium felsineum DSM 794]